MMRVSATSLIEFSAAVWAACRLAMLNKELLGAYCAPKLWHNKIKRWKLATFLVWPVSGFVGIS